MHITKQAISGTLESSDCLVVVSPCASREIYLESPAKKRFGAYLEALINATLDSLDVQTGRIEITDRGALDYCIEARIKTAVQRSEAQC